MLIMAALVGLLSRSTDAIGQQQRSEEPALPTLTNAHDAHSVTSEEAARRYPVHLRGVATYYDP
jgi:hypothetical protein